MVNMERGNASGRVDDKLYPNYLPQVTLRGLPVGTPIEIKGAAARVVQE